MSRRERYREYLQSDLWAKIRANALACASWRCQVCNTGRELEVHHRTYARVGHETPDDLTVLCATCHRLFHEYGRLANSEDRHAPGRVIDLLTGAESPEAGFQAVRRYLATLPDVQTRHEAAGVAVGFFLGQQVKA